MRLPVVLCVVAFACVSAAEALPALNPDVRQDTIQSTICTPGYTASVRPATVYTNGVKLKLVRAGGEDETEMSTYELDHIIPLALGGHPRAIDNLQLQPWPEARRKDRIEVKLQCLVCTGQVTLAEAQTKIAEDWEATYHTYASVPCHRHHQPRDEDIRPPSTPSETAANTPAQPEPSQHDVAPHKIWTLRAQIWWPFHFGSS
jgi:hypothetical protein